jgi:RimJ/RimL family protein N-acetyltransferase
VTRDALVLRTPRLELRPEQPGDIEPLLVLARAGVHPPETMPFDVPWTDGLETPEGGERFREYQRSTIAALAPTRWQLLFVVREAGRLVGAQELAADGFPETREVRSGSWLGAAHQGRGLGTEMRAAILELAFGVLGARRAVSGAIEGNPASMGVSRKLGYREVGRSTGAPRGAELVHIDLAVTRDQWHAARAIPVEIDGVDGELLARLGAC